MNDDGQAIETIEPGAAGAPEGAVAEPTTNDVAEMYKELGIKAPAPTGAAKGRPKSSAVRAQDVSQDDAGDSKTGKQGNVDSKSQSKDAPTDGTDGDTGDDSDPKGAKVGKNAGKVSAKSAEADGGVRTAKSEAEGDTERGSEGDPDDGTDRTGQAAHDEGAETAEGEDLEGKRPGKSNPKVEQRFQRLTSEVKERDEIITKLQQQLQATTQQREQIKIAQEDPEYTIDDFRRVSDEDGNVIDLDPERAELAWRRWKDGYEQRATERQAKAQHEAVEAQRQTEMSERIMRQSVEAYDTIAGLMDDYPELSSTSGQFDPEFASIAMPIIRDALVYQPGTEPGNPDGARQVVLGMKLNPKSILAAMDKIRHAKRSLPLNGTDDNVEVGSNVAVAHGRSSDPTVNAANELYKTLKINKRF